MKPMDRRRLTVDVIVRQQICFRLGQKVIDRSRMLQGVVIALADEGCFLRGEILKEHCRHIERWFVKYSDARPFDDGRCYA